MGPGSEFNEMVKFFIKREAKMKSTDLDGNSCLHIYLETVKLCKLFRHSDYQPKQDTLLLLFEHGADVLARNFAGQSVSDEAHRQPHSVCRWSGIKRYDSYMKDLWDSVLALSGYDIADFHKTHMKGYSRVGRYCNCYTRSKFEEL